MTWCWTPPPGKNCARSSLPQEATYPFRGPDAESSRRGCSLMAGLAFPEVTIAIRTLVALVYLAAAFGKMRYWPVFQGVISNYRLLPDFLVAPVAYVLPPVEALLGATLLLGLAFPWPEVGAAALLLLFAVAMGINLRRGRRHIDCGCFQSALKQTLSWTLVVRNVVMALLLGLAMLSAGGSADL